MVFFVFDKIALHGVWGNGGLVRGMKEEISIRKKRLEKYKNVIKGQNGSIRLYNKTGEMEM
jgi:hypothetical protein